MNSTRELVVEPIGLNVESLPHPIPWQDLFQNDHPVEIEIGMGKGTFLTQQARAHAEMNFLGLEYANWFWRYASDRLRRNGCTNVRTARAEAAYFFKEFVPDESVSAVHIYFPDPWPKNRHHKRRLIQPPFVAQIHRVLISGGKLRLATDHAEYFAQMQIVLASSALKLAEYDRPEAAEANEVAGTNFERKYRRESRAVYTLAALKPSKI